MEVIDKVTKAVDMAVEKAVNIIAADGRRVITGKLEKITVKDGIKAEVTMSQHDPLRYDLYDAQGLAVLMVVAGKDPYEGERKAALPDPDQTSFLRDEYTENDGYGMGEAA